MTIHRREFLESIGAVSMAALPLGGRETRAEASPIADAWDVSWADRLKTKHLAVFDSPGFSEGAALFRATVWKNQYKDVYGTNPSDMTAVLVVRHEGIWLAMNDDFWRKYDIGKRKKFKDSETNRIYDRNPIASTAPGLPPQMAEMNVPKFIGNGGIVLACHLALTAYVVDLIKKEEKLKDDEAEALARKSMISGVNLQPSGVFAVLRAQEAGCHYILAS